MQWTIEELTDLYMVGQECDMKAIDLKGNPTYKGTPISREVMRARITSMYSGLNNFSMRKVVTGARRKWQR